MLERSGAARQGGNSSSFVMLNKIRKKYFNAIYDAARAQDTNALNRLKSRAFTAQKLDINLPVGYHFLMVDGHTPLSKLASEQDFAAVEFLIAQGIKPVEAYIGYELANNREKADEYKNNLSEMESVMAVARIALQLIMEERRDDFDHFKNSSDVHDSNIICDGAELFACAIKGHTDLDDKVQQFITTNGIGGVNGGEDLQILLSLFLCVGYAIGGHTQKIEPMLAKSKNAKYAALLGYMHTGNIEAYQAIAVNAPSRLFGLLVSNADVISFMGMMSSGLAFYPEMIQCLMSFIDEESLRKRLARVFNRTLTHWDDYETRMLEKSAKLNHLMRSQKFSYEQALAWQRQDVFFWLTSVQMTVRQYHLPNEINVLILTYIADELTISEAQELLARMPLAVYQGMLLRELLAYVDPIFQFGRCHKSRAESFIKPCQEAGSLNDMHSLLQYQSGLFAGKLAGNPNSLFKHERPLENREADAYTQIVTRHAERLARLV